MITCQICQFSNDDSILSHVRTKHGMSAKEYREKFNGSPLRRAWLLSSQEAMERFREIGHRNKGRTRSRKLAPGTWSREHGRCIKCNTTDWPHSSHGLCKRCYDIEQQSARIERKNKSLTILGEEGVSYVVCRECGKPFECLMTNGHLREHGMTETEYHAKHGVNTTRPSLLMTKMAVAISDGRKKLMAGRGYLNPQSQRDQKRIEMTKRLAESRLARTSGVEDVVAEWLSSHGYVVCFADAPVTESETCPVAYRQFPMMGRYVVDFAIPSRKIVIEVLGSFWHGWDFVSGQKPFERLAEAVKKNVCTDKVRMSDISASGWTPVELWEHDVKSGRMGEVLVACLKPSNRETAADIAPQLIALPKAKEVRLMNDGFVSAKPIASSPRRLYNARWLAAQNGIALLPGLLVPQGDYDQLAGLVSLFGDERAVPEETLRSELAKLRSRGFPFYCPSHEEMVRKWMAISGGSVAQRQDGRYLWDGFATDLASSFHPHIFECRKNGKMSPIEFFSNDDMLLEAIYKVLCLKGVASDSTIRDACRNDSKSSRVNNFPPKVALTLARLLLRDGGKGASVLDPCAGFGGRLLGFLAAKVESYVGIDLSTRTCDGLKAEAKFLASYGANTNVEISCCNCVAKMAALAKDGASFDMIMTSPPFVDREEYVGVEAYHDLSQWIDAFMRPFLDEAFVLLKGGGRMALYLGKAESKGNRLPDIVDSLSESVGFMRDVSIPFVTVSGESNRRRKAMRETYVQVWRKG